MPLKISLIPQEQVEHTEVFTSVCLNFDVMSCNDDRLMTGSCIYLVQRPCATLSILFNFALSTIVCSSGPQAY